MLIISTWTFLQSVVNYDDFVKQNYFDKAVTKINKNYLYKIFFLQIKKIFCLKLKKIKLLPPQLQFNIVKTEKKFRNSFNIVWNRPKGA